MLTGQIREIHRDSRCTYGAKRVALDLAEARTESGARPVDRVPLDGVVDQLVVVLGSAGALSGSAVG